MSSELLGSAENTLKGNLGGAWDILSGYADAYTDLGIGKQFGGAAAAYSLRDVGAMNGPVVRVRRDSDNSEQDFPASAVTQIPDWCNQSVIKPLDVRELNSGGSGNRDGNFVIAKAAYSLRSLGDRQATVAATNDTVARADGKYVVQVRRNVDGTIKSFTADEVTDGTLLSFVNESFTSSLPLDVQGSAAAAYSLRNLSSTYSGAVVNVRRSSDDTTRDFTADSITNGDLVAFCGSVNLTDTYTTTSNSEISTEFIDRSNFTLTYTDLPSAGNNKFFNIKNKLNNNNFGKGKYTVTFTATVTGNATVGVSRDGSSMSTTDTFTSSDGTASHSFTATSTSQDAGNFYFKLRSETGSDESGVVVITDFNLQQVFCDGHVATWYDQSGNSKHATQSTTTYQPKIVDSGSLLTDGGLLFDGDDTSLDSGSSTSLGTEFFVTGVMNLNTYVDENAAIITNAEAGGGDRLFIGTSDILRIRDDSTNISSSLVLSKTADNLFTYQASASSFTFVKNGTTDAKSALSGGQSYRYIGGGSGFNLSANMKELIIYASDQTEKRRAIEESIATANGITLASFSRDGMVRTWYDQSVTDEGGATATGNHAVQATAANQPKIVSSGSLVSNGIDFDGTNDVLETSLIPPNAATLIGVANWDVLNSTQLIVGARDSTNQRSYLGMQSSNVSVLGNQNSTLTGGSISAGANFVLFGVHDVGKRLISTNGTVVSNTDGAASNNTNQGYIIGGLNNAGTAASFLNGKIAEVIVYASDQTDNRGAFEANIAEHYNISGVPAEDNQVNGFVETWYDQSGNNRPLIQTTATNQPLIVESGVFLNGVKANEATSNTDMMHLRVSADGTTANFGTDDWASGASSKLGLIYVGTVLEGPNTSNNAVVWGGGRGVNSYQEGGVSLQVTKAGTDSWKLVNEREGLSPEVILVALSQNTDADVVWYGTANNRDFTVNVNGSENTDTESADLDVREDQALSLFGAFGSAGGAYYQRSSAGVCKECFLYAGDNITNVPAVATKINEHYSIY